MTVRSFASFDAAIPSAQQVTASATVAGRQLLEFLTGQLRARGFTITPVARHDSYGWYAEVSVDRGVIWIMLQMSDNWLLITRPIAPILRRVLRSISQTEHQRVCEAIHNVLAADARFESIRWYTPEDFQNKLRGSAQP